MYVKVKEFYSRKNSATSLDTNFQSFFFYKLSIKLSKKSVLRNFVQFLTVIPPISFKI